MSGGNQQAARQRDAKGRFVPAGDGPGRPDARVVRAKPVVARQRSGAGTGAQARKLSKRAFSPDKQACYFAALAETANSAKAAEMAGVSKSTVINWRKANAEFAARWRAAMAEGYADLEMQLLAQARFGLTEESATHTDDEGVRHRTARRDSGLVGIRLLAMNQAHAIAAELAGAAEAELIGHQESAALVARITVALQSVRHLSDARVASVLGETAPQADADSADADSMDAATGPVEVKGLIEVAARTDAQQWSELSVAILIGGARLARLRDAVRRG
jgi:hypothetical protein